MKKVKFRVRLRRKNIQRSGLWGCSFTTMPIQDFIVGLLNFTPISIRDLSIVKLVELPYCPLEYDIVIKAKNKKEEITTYLAALMGAREEIYKYFEIIKIY